MGRSLAVLALCATLVGGCGGGSSDTDKFKQRYRAQRADLRAIATDIGTTIGGAYKQAERRLAGQFNALAGRMRALRDRLRTLAPPTRVRGDYENLKAALEKGEHDLRAIESALRANDAATASASTHALLSDLPSMTRYADAVSSKLKIR